MELIKGLQRDALEARSHAELVELIETLIDSPTVSARVSACVAALGDNLTEFDAARAAVALRLAHELDNPDPKGSSSAQLASEIVGVLAALEAVKDKAEEFDDEYKELQEALSAPLVD